MLYCFAECMCVLLSSLEQSIESAIVVQKSDDEEFVFDYYAMSSSDADTAMPDSNADLPVIQVRICSCTQYRSLAADRRCIYLVWHWHVSCMCCKNCSTHEQVREDWLYLGDESVDSEGGSEDSNAEDWYGNDYPSSSQSESSDRGSTSDENV